MSFLSARTKTGYSQAKVAKDMGVSDAAVSMWETGKAPCILAGQAGGVVLLLS